MKIAVGTTSNWKIKFLDEVLRDLGVEAEILPDNVESGVPEQPVGDNLVKEGALNRARAAFENNDGCDLALGIEVGYEKREDGKFMMFSYAAAVDKRGDYSAKSSSLLLPRFFQNVLTNSEPLRNYVKEYRERDHHPSSLYLAKTVDDREPFIKEAIRTCLLVFLHREEYGHG